jgi:hypothetical protein
MGELVDTFAGKVDGELIRTVDWNGLIAAIEAQFAALAEDLAGRLDEVAGSVAALDQRVTDLQGQVAPLASLADALRARIRRVDLEATRTSFAMGERGEIIARVSDIEGNPLNFRREVDRPWVDFVTVWGALKAAPGFTSRGGASDRTVTVQVNEAGEARVLLRAEAGAALAEEQEREIEAVLATEVSAGMTLASAILTAPTPGSTQLRNAFQVVTQAYERTDTLVMRSYLDTYYIGRPSQVIPPIQAINWRDHNATVLAFVKPDDSPTTADGAQAVASIRVRFRDWIYPWIVEDYTRPPPIIVEDFRHRFRDLVLRDYTTAIDGIYDLIDARTNQTGIIGKFRQYNAAMVAVEGLTLENPPVYLKDLKDTVGGGLVLQQGLILGQATAPSPVQGVAAGKAVAVAAAQGQKAAETTAAEMRAETRRVLADAESSIESAVTGRVQTLVGQVAQVRQLAETANVQLQDVSAQLQHKAGIDVVSKLLVRGGG